MKHPKILLLSLFILFVSSSGFGQKMIHELPRKTNVPDSTWLMMIGNPTAGTLYKMSVDNFRDSVANNIDTTSLSNRINLKLNKTDTASLSNRIDAIAGGGLSPIPDLSTLINVSGSSAVPTAGHYSVFNVLDFGLVGDSSTDNTTAFRTLLALIPDGAAVYFPGGDYIFTDSIVIAKSVNLYGDGHSSYSFYTFTNKRGKGATNLYYTSSSKDFLIFKTSVTNNNPDSYVHDLSITNTSTTPTAGAGVKMVDNVLHHTFERVTIKRFHTNIKAYSASFISINDCDIVAPYKYGIDLGNVAEPDCGVYNVFNCRIISGLHNTGDSTIGIIYRGSGEAKITHCDFNAQGVFNRPTQFLYQFYSTFELGQTSIVNITNNFFENYQRTAIYMTNVVSLPIYSIKIVGNSISPFNNTGGQAFNAIYMSGPFRDVTIMDNGGHSLFSSPSVTDYAFLRVDSVEQLKIYPGSQDGWAVYDSITNSVDHQFVFFNPTIENANASKGLVIDNRSSGANANANIELKADGNSGYIYQTSDAYGFGLDNTLVAHTPAGSLAAYGAQLNLKIANNGTVFMPELASGAGDREVRWNTSTGELTYTTISGGSGTPGGSDTEIQFNDAGSFNGSSNFTYDGTTLALSGLGNSIMTVTGTGTAVQGNTVHFNHTNSGAGIAYLLENDRGSFASYGSTLYGGSAAAGGLFGLTTADKLFIYTGGANNLGMVIGNYGAQPLSLGTDNTVRITVKSSGVVNLAAAARQVFADDTAAGVGGLVTGDLYQTSAGVLMVKQ